MDRDQLRQIIYANQSAATLTDEQLVLVAAAERDPGLPSSCMNWAERIAIPLLHEMAERLGKLWQVGDKVRGELMVGNNERGEIVVNFDRDRVGHIVFRPAQARDLAELLRRQAAEGEKLQLAMAN